MEVSRFQPSHRLGAIFRQLRFAGRGDGAGEEARLPFFAAILPGGSLVPLPLLELLFQLGRTAILPCLDGLCDVVPESSALVRQLFLFRRYLLGLRKERVDVDQDMFFLGQPSVWDEHLVRHTPYRRPR